MTDDMKKWSHILKVPLDYSAPMDLENVVLLITEDIIEKLSTVEQDLFWPS